MEWLELHIDTNPTGLEPITDMLDTCGVSGVQIDDEADFLNFLENNRHCWDYVDEELLRDKKGLCRITFIFRKTRTVCVSLRKSESP